MATVMEVQARLTGNASNMVKSFKDARAAASNMEKEVGAKQSKFKALGSKLASGLKTGFIKTAKFVGIAAAAIIGTALVKGFQRMSAIENAEASLRGLGHSAGAVKKIMNNALKSVKGTAFGLDEAAGVASTAVAAGVKPGKQLQSTLKLVADAATIGGTSMGDMGAIFNKVATSNKVQGDVIAQLHERNIPIVKLLGETLGKTSEQVYDMSKKGQIDFAMFGKAMEQGMGGAALKSGNTTTGAFKNMMAALSRIGVALLSGIYPSFKKVFGGITGWLDKMTPPLAKFSKMVGTKLTEGVRAFGAAWKANNGDVTSSGFAGFMERVANALRRVQKFVGTLDFSSWDKFKKSLNMGGAGGRISKTFKELKPAVKEFFALLPRFGAALGDIGKGSLEIFIRGLEFLAKHVDTIIKFMPLIVGAFVAWKVSTLAVTAATNHLLASQVAMAPVFLASNITRLTAARLDYRLATARGAATAATVTNTGAEKRNLIARSGSAIKGAAVHLAQSTRVVAGWVAMSAAAVVSGTKTAAVWTGTVVRRAAVGATSFMVHVAKVVAGWTVMAARATAQAVRMAAAWFIALGPIGWAIGAVIGLVALVILNWDKIKKFTVKAWAAITGWVVGAWKDIKKWTFQTLMKVAAWIANKFNDIKNTGRRIWFGLRDIISEAWTSIKKFTYRLVMKVAAWIANKFNDIKNTGRRIWFGLRDIISRAWNGIKESIRKSWAFIRDRIFGPVKDFVTKTIPNAFRRGVDSVKKFWGRMENIAKAPIRFLIDVVYNKGIRGVFNSVMGFIGKDKWKLGKLKVPGFEKGGKAPKGWAMVGEKGPELVNFTNPGRVYNARQTGAAMKHEDTGALGPGSGQVAQGGRTPAGMWSTPLAAAIRNMGNRLSINPGGASSFWKMPQAAGTLSGASGLRIGMGMGSPRINTSTGGLPAGAIAYASMPNNIKYAPGGGRFPPKFRAATSMHEIMHLLGFPHTNANSIMNPVIGKNMKPTGRDIGLLQQLFPGGSGKLGSGGGFNPVKWIADKVVSVVTKLLDAIPGAGKMFDVALEVGKHLFHKAKDWAFDKIKGGGEDSRDKGTSTGTNKFGAKGPAVFDGGGMFKKGMTGIHTKVKPDRVLSAEQWGWMRKAAVRNIPGFNPSVSGRRDAPMINVNMTALIENPWGEGYLEAKVVKVAEDVSSDMLHDVSRYARNSRGTKVRSAR